MSDVALLPYGLRKSFLKASELLRLLESFFFLIRAPCIRGVSFAHLSLALSRDANCSQDSKVSKSLRKVVGAALGCRTRRI